MADLIIVPNLPGEEPMVIDNDKVEALIAVPVDSESYKKGYRTVIFFSYPYHYKSLKTSDPIKVLATKLSVKNPVEFKVFVLESPEQCRILGVYSKRELAEQSASKCFDSSELLVKEYTLDSFRL